ncbi:alpha/beta fold hydrolase [Pseudonocardia endophytica]|uniref:Pimeloyl-ACP methyl ester carboxylesterase n=1 Tax=Pseudonocardia endophytica TaxID=401976 RepID=A0A4R1HEX7_PSEEN|nr:alpha/beta fold hydrolase [Pseudonocardia endophytica]TCK20677.1 pimeloyl-ACP methyl ester carboxylesterase [Pseudonocardia endophytica]
MQVNGKELAVEIQGDGPAVLLVHGLGGTSNFYQPQVEALAERFTVIRPDMEGSGRSPVTGELSIDSFAADLAALLDELSIESARVVGHSMATLTVRRLAATHPDRVSHLALLGAVNPPADPSGPRGRAATVRGEGQIAVADAIMNAATSDATRRDHPAAAALVRELVLRQDPEGYARSCEALAGATDPGPVEKSLPLLLLTGDEDKVGPPDASRALADAHGSAVLEVFDGCGHWTAIEKPAEVTAHLLKFF